MVGRTGTAKVGVGNLWLVEQLGDGIFMGLVILMYMPAYMSHWTWVVDMDELHKLSFDFFFFLHL